ncbi:hypothetical protein B938_19015 [Bacillus velezensis AS43.3]|nr:hypothetical protein B938_19015 [Bacillus velezensis AS43.3]
MPVAGFRETIVNDIIFPFTNVLPNPKKEAVIQESPFESQLLSLFPYVSINPFASRKPSGKGF